MSWDKWLFVGLIVFVGLIAKLLSKGIHRISSNDINRKKDAFKMNSGMIDDYDEENYDIMNKSR